MRFLSADWIFPLHISPIRNGVIQISTKGEIINIFKSRNEVDFENLEVFNGILCPGFINAHCHMELSHLINNSELGKGLLYFIESLRERNNFTIKEIQFAIQQSEKQMIDNGIVAVGDICNTTDTILQKKKKNIHYYNFIETFQVKEEKIEETIYEARVIRDAFRRENLQATIVPHAPYSVPPRLVSKIVKEFDGNDKLLCIHNQETLEENELFQNKRGKLFNWLKNFDASPEIWLKRNKSSDIIKDLSVNKPMLVHNTFSSTEDIRYNCYYCTCPKSNLAIEGKLPDYSIFNLEKLCVGTDSLASNNSLSILDELFIIQENSKFTLEDLLKISSKNGAKILGFTNLGTFEIGKTPGINLIQEASEFKLSKKTIVKTIKEK